MITMNKKSLPIGDLKDLVGGGVSAGTLTYWIGETADIPDGWIIANGASLAITQYNELFEVIGYKYGGSGNTFVLPYLTDGKYVRMAYNSGEIVEDSLPNISGYFRTEAQVYGATGGAWVGGAFYNAEPTGHHGISSIISGQPTHTGIRFDASRSNPIYGRSLTRILPYSMHIIPIIKY